jgi:hypothetical protein
MSIAAFGNPVNRETSNERERQHQKIKNKQLLIFGINPFKTPEIERMIERNTKAVQKQREAWLKIHGNNKNNSN